jgi:hypothetical protein
VPVILATQETETRRSVVQSQSWQIVGETLSQKKKITKELGVALHQPVEWLKV